MSSDSFCERGLRLVPRLPTMEALLSAKPAACKEPKMAFRMQERSSIGMFLS